MTKDIISYIKKEFPIIPKKHVGFVIYCVKNKFPSVDGSVIAKLVKDSSCVK